MRKWTLKILEAGIFKRPKQGIYEFENILNYNTEIAKEIFIASFNQNNTIKRTLNNYQHSDSYFMFIDWQYLFEDKK